MLKWAKLHMYLGPELKISGSPGFMGNHKNTWAQSSIPKISAHERFPDVFPTTKLFLSSSFLLKKSKGKKLFLLPELREEKEQTKTTAGGGTTFSFPRQFPRAERVTFSASPIAVACSLQSLLFTKPPITYVFDLKRSGSHHKRHILPSYCHAHAVPAGGFIKIHAHVVMD